MITSRRLPHRRQSDRGRNCGAACLAMPLEHYKIRPSNLKEITSQVSDADRNGQPMCYNNLIAQYAQKRGLYCSVVSARDPRTFIPFCLEQGLELFVNYHPDPKDPSAHYSFVSYVADDKVYLNDPQFDAPLGVNYEVPMDTLCQGLQKRGSEDELAISDTILVFAKENSDVPVRYIPDGDNRFPFFECIGDKAICVLAPYTGQWIEVSKLLAAPTP